MTRKLSAGIVVGLLVTAGLFGLIIASLQFNTTAQAKPDKVDGINVPSGRIPQEIKNNKYPRTYFPGTEKLGENEMRITALGTGMPNVAYGSASASFLVELGNGDKFLFDFGNGAMNSLAALQVDYSETDKVFIGHLHTDHAGDLSILLIGGWFGSRHTPLHVYGPSALLPEHGIKAHTEHLMKAWDWDISSRAGGLPDAGGRIVPHEHDYSKTAVIYDENGVQVTSFPAVHIRDGTVSYRLDWEGLSFVFSSDTEPNQWYLEEAKDADVAVHGTWPTAKAWAKITGQSEELSQLRGQQRPHVAPGLRQDNESGQTSPGRRVSLLEPPRYRIRRPRGHSRDL